MRSIYRVSLLFVVILFFALSACGGGAPSSPSSASNLAYTRIWQTVAAGQTMTASAQPPTQTATATPQVSLTPKSTNTPLISATPGAGDTAVASTAAATIGGPRPTSQAACDNSQFVTDVTYSDGSDVPAGQAFVKTWRIKNLGPCQWNQDYKLAFGWGGDGTNWGSTPGTYFSKLVAPGDMIDLSIELDAPTKAGTYGATYRTQNDNGYNFGPSLTILITVK